MLTAGLAAAGCHRSPTSPSGGGAAPLPSASSSLTITATWDVTADIDLHVVEPAPSSTDIFWANPGPTASGGVLDGDADQDCKTGSAGHKEVVRWASSPPNGMYTVLLDLYDSCNVSAINYTVTIADAKTTLPPITGTLTGAGDHGNGPATAVKTFSHIGAAFAARRLLSPGALLADGFLQLPLSRSAHSG